MAKYDEESTPRGTCPGWLACLLVSLHFLWEWKSQKVMMHSPNLVKSLSDHTISVQAVVRTTALLAPDTNVKINKGKNQIQNKEILSNRLIKGIL